MEPKQLSTYVDDGKDWFFRNGKFERGEPPISLMTADRDAALAAAGYQRIGTFGAKFGFGMQVSQGRGENYLVSLKDEDSTERLIWIESFPDYMEYLRQFGHLGTLAEASATRYYIENAHELALDRDWGVWRNDVRDVEDRRTAFEERCAAR